MGAFDAPQDEDCLSLNVWAPPGDGHPVLVFVHGGGFTSGSGGLAWYDGAELAAFGDLVVVTVNYRLGVPGFLRLPGVSEGNLGLLDLLAALRWVRDNIAAFGGDPGAVTACGQSAGAQSILALMSAPRAAGLFHRAILQSTPAGMSPDPPAAATRTGLLLLNELHATSPAEVPLRGEPVDALARVPVGELLAAQQRVAGRTAVPLSPVPPFQLVADGDLVAADLVGAVGGGVPVLMGTTRDEASAFIPGDRDAAALVTERMFAGPGRRLAEELTRKGAPAWTYRFDWHPPRSPYGACHCVELPFVLGSAAAWREAPMLDGDPPPDLVRRVRRAWTGFARDGDPGWPRETVHHFTG
ncbi:MAG: carboxylesterase/lipase family protein [Nonomuraea sp.]|nr:carboxylesterase/lipase family protein [Nonomuraea sp.]